MAFLVIDPNTIKVGDPITKELLDLVKNNFDNHEFRLNQFETTGGQVFILNSAFHLGNLNTNDPFIFYYKATQDFDLTDFRAQIFNKNGITSGTLGFDLQKSVDTNYANFNTVLTADLNFNFATDANYAEKTASFSPSSTVQVGDVLRIEVTSMPLGFKDKILIYLGGA